MPRLEQSFCITVLNISSSNLAWVMTPGQLELSHQVLHVSIDLLQLIPARHNFCSIISSALMFLGSLYSYSMTAPWEQSDQGSNHLLP